jgi:hypothetical protein
VEPPQPAAAVAAPPTEDGADKPAKKRGFWSRFFKGKDKPKPGPSDPNQP